MKNKKLLFNLILSMVMSFSIVSCTDDGKGKKDKTDDNPSVLVEDDDKVNTGDITVIDNEDGTKDVEIRVKVDENSEFKGVDYDNYDYKVEGDEIVIVLHDVDEDVRVRIDLVPGDSSISGGNKYTKTIKQGDGAYQLLTVDKGYELLSSSENEIDYFNLGVDDEGKLKLGLLFKDDQIPSLKLTFTETKIEPGKVNNKANLTDEEINAILPKQTEKERFVYYSANGGTIVNNYFEGSGYYKRIDVDHHLRPNSDQGSDIFIREGYYLESWNTKANGTGTRIGLGSRFTDINKNTILYAQWIKENDQNNFNYEDNGKGVTLTGTKGINNYSKIVIPNYIGEEKVLAIGENFLSDKTIDELYLPYNLHDISNNAFKNSTIKALHFYETLQFRDSAFVNTKINQVFINATIAPRSMTLEHTHIADGIDRILLNSSKKNMVFFGGCAFAYGLRSPMIIEEYKDYYVTNLGVTGGCNAGFQFDILSKILKSGDIMIHAPEEMSKYQLMYENNAEIRIFKNAEANYDMLTYVDVDKIDDFFDVYNDYLKSKLEQPAQLYSDYCPNIDEYGDILPDVSVNINGSTRRRDDAGEPNKRYAKEGEINCRPDYVTQASMNLLSSYYAKLSSKGVKCLFTFSPLNKDGFLPSEITNEVWKTFENNVRTYLTSYPIIGHIDTYIYDSTYFFEEDYHLTYEGARIRTESLIDDLNAYFDSLK